MELAKVVLHKDAVLVPGSLDGILASLLDKLGKVHLLFESHFLS